MSSKQTETPIFRAGDAVFVGKTAGFTKRVADVVSVQHDATGRVVATVAARGTGFRSVWFQTDLRPAALRHWTPAQVAA